MTERFIKTIKRKICRKLAANDSKFYLSYWNKLVDQYNNTYYRLIGKKLIDADYSTLTEEIESSHQAPKFEVGVRVTITKYTNISTKCYTKN